MTVASRPSDARPSPEPRPGRLTLGGRPDETIRTLAEALVRASPDPVRIGCAWVPEGEEAERRVALHRREHPLEWRAIERAVMKRRLEFITARDLTRAVMGENPSIGQGQLGEPLWPQGVVGSISHSHGLVVVALADRSACRALGIDLEPDRPLPEGVAEWVGRGDEIRASDASLFAAKEAYYKAHASLHHRLLEFSEVRVEALGDGRWRASEVASGLPTAPIEGRWIRRAGWLAALCWLD